LVLKNLAPGKILTVLKACVASEWPFLVLFCFYFIALIIWICLDRSVPIWDGARHLLDSYDLKDELSAPVSFGTKLYALFTCAYPYPPLFNWVHCLFLMSPIPRTIGDHLPILVFFALGVFSLYKLGWQLFDDAAIGLVGMAIFCMLPAVCMVTHINGLVDIPLTSMCFLALWLIARWNAAPSLANALAAGGAIGLACLTKQMGAIYLAPAIIIVLLQRLLAGDVGRAIQFSYGLGLGTIIFLSWLLLDLANIGPYQQVASYGIGLSVWFRKIGTYLLHLPRFLTGPVSILFVVSLFNFPAQRKLWLPASTVLGFSVLCALRWGGEEPRYVLPVFGYLALSIAAFLVRLWRTRLPSLRVFSAAFGLYLLTVYFFFNFTPYPIARLAAVGLIDQEFNGLGCHWSRVAPSEPYSPEPVAYNWLLRLIHSEPLNHPAVIIFGVDTPNCQATSLAYLAKQRGIPVELRTLSPSQLEVDIGQDNLLEFKLYPDWYVTMKNDQSAHPLQLKSGHELDKYKAWREYFETSGKFSKTGEFLLPDGKSCMVLYRKLESTRPMNE
jgi:4-amino-4-deoxy-L-arabinose transferase-like glycosyltransferase